MCIIHYTIKELKQIYVIKKNRFASETVREMHYMPLRFISSGNLLFVLLHYLRETRIYYNKNVKRKQTVFQ